MAAWHGAEKSLSTGNTERCIVTTTGEFDFKFTRFDSATGFLYGKYLHKEISRPVYDPDGKIANPSNVYFRHAEECRRDYAASSITLSDVVLKLASPGDVIQAQVVETACEGKCENLTTFDRLFRRLFNGQLVYVRPDRDEVILSKVP